MTTAAEKSALQAAAQTTLDLANALAVGPTQAELDAANAQIASLTNAVAAMQAKVDLAKTHIAEMTALDAAEDAKRAETLAALG